MSFGKNNRIWSLSIIKIVKIIQLQTRMIFHVSHYTRLIWNMKYQSRYLQWLNFWYKYILEISFKKLIYWETRKPVGRKILRIFFHKIVGNFKENLFCRVCTIQRSANFENIWELYYDVCHSFCSISRQLNVFYEGVLKIHAK